MRSLAPRRTSQWNASGWKGGLEWEIYMRTGILAVPAGGLTQPQLCLSVQTMRLCTQKHVRVLMNTDNCRDSREEPKCIWDIQGECTRKGSPRHVLQAEHLTQNCAPASLDQSRQPVGQGDSSVTPGYFPTSLYSTLLTPQALTVPLRQPSS